MLIGVISLALAVSLLSCSLLVEERRAGSCRVVDDPTGWHGTLKVNCPGLSFTLLYDNSPEGRAPLILGVRGADAEKLSGKPRHPYVLRTGDYEELEGSRYEEEWRIGGYRLRGYEYFVNGGAGCYEEEERAFIELLLGDERVVLLDHYREETDCGGN